MSRPLTAQVREPPIEQVVSILEPLNDCSKYRQFRTSRNSRNVTLHPTWSVVTIGNEDEKIEHVACGNFVELAGTRGRGNAQGRTRFRPAVGN